jgi:hypothetical protein
MRIPATVRPYWNAAIAIFLLPIVWWAGPVWVALAALLAAYLLLIRFRSILRHSSDAEGSEPKLDIEPHTAAALIGASAIALIAVLVALPEPILVLRVAISTFLASRLVALFPAAKRSLAWLIGGNLAAALLAVAALGSDTFLNCFLFQCVWFTLDLAVQDVLTKTGSSTGTAPQGDDPPSEIPEDKLPDGHLRVDVKALLGAGGLITVLIASLLVVEALGPLGEFEQELADSGGTRQQSAESIDEEWAARFPGVFGRTHAESRAAAPMDPICTNAERLDRYGLHTLAAPASIGVPQADGWGTVAGQFSAIPLMPASDREANSLFGASCDNDHNLRRLEASRLAIADGYVGNFDRHSTVAVGAVHALQLPDGRRLLLARASDGAGYTALLLAWADSDAFRRPWIVSTRGTEGMGGVLFGPDQQPQNAYHLWYGALSEDGWLSASAVDIIDVSGDAPLNTGLVAAWGASTCGQVLGDPLYPAEQNCVEQPAWAFWLTGFEYITNSEIDVTWNVRRQFGHAGEPATYDDPFDAVMRGRYERTSAGWRLVEVDAPALDGLEQQLALNDVASQ